MIVRCTYDNVKKTKFTLFYDLAKSFGLTLVDFTMTNDSEMTLCFKGDGTKIHHFGKALEASL